MKTGTAATLNLRQLKKPIRTKRWSHSLARPAVPLTSGLMSDEWMHSGTFPTRAEVEQRTWIWKLDAGPPRVANCALCFSIDIDAYRRYLRRDS